MDYHKYFYGCMYGNGHEEKRNSRRYHCIVRSAIALPYDIWE